MTGPSLGYPLGELLAWAADDPRALAVDGPQASMTIGEFVDSTVRIAAWLRDRGVRSGEVVAAALSPTLELVVAVAMLHESAVSTVLPPGWDPNGAARFDWVVSDHAVAGMDPDRTLMVDDEALRRWSAGEPVADPRPFASGAAVQRWIFSSGTTGAPKAVAMSVDMTRRRCASAQRHWMPAEPFMSLLGLSTVTGYQTAVQRLATRRVVLVPGTAVENLATLLRHDVAAVKGSPAQLAALLDQVAKSGASLPSLEVVQSAGSALPERLAADIETRLGVEIVNLYGSTEVGTVARRRGGGPASVAGELVDDCRVEIVDADGRVLPDGESGLIRIRRDPMPSGYVGGVGDAFRGGWFHPGDMGAVRRGVLHLEGRQSELLNAAGVKVDPGRVEQVALAHAGIRDAACFGETDERGVVTLAIAVVSDDPVDSIALVAHLSDRLGDAAPRRVVRMAAIPRNPTGKIIRDALPRISTRQVPWL